MIKLNVCQSCCCIEFREDESVDEPPAADDHIHHCSDRWRLRYDVLPHAE